MPDQTSAEIHFPRGLPGFEDHKRFILIERETFAPILILQSATETELRFLTVPVWLADPGYQFGISDEDLATLELPEQPRPDGDVRCLAILSAREGESLTANLLAPVVINPRIRLGMQAVRGDARYSHCTSLGAACL
jgi:flagellar assembly factor FliW